MSDALVPTIATLVARVAGPSRTPAQVTRDTRLADEYWLDSVELLEVFIACERTFAIAFDEQRDFATGSIDTLGALADLVARKQADRR